MAYKSNRNTNKLDISICITIKYWETYHSLSTGESILDKYIIVRKEEKNKK